MIFSLPEGYKGKYMVHNFLSMYFSLQSILQYRFYAQLCVNNVKVTVNTCTCTDVFTITTKDQSGGI